MRKNNFGSNLFCASKGRLISIQNDRLFQKTLFAVQSQNYAYFCYNWTVLLNQPVSFQLALKFTVIFGENDFSLFLLVSKAYLAKISPHHIIYWKLPYITIRKKIITCLFHMTNTALFR